MSTRSSASLRRASIASSAATPPPAIRTRCRSRSEGTLLAPPFAIRASLPAVRLAGDSWEPFDDRLPRPEHAQVVQPAAFEHEDGLVTGEIDGMAFEPEPVRIEWWARLDELDCALFGLWLEL